jgi:hypothetical protein
MLSREFAVAKQRKRRLKRLVNCAHLLLQLVKDIWVSIVNGASISWISRTTRVPGIARIANVAKVTKMFIHDHVPVKLANVATGQLMDMSTVKLTDGAAAHAMYVLAADKANGGTARVVDVISHEIP